MGFKSILTVVITPAEARAAISAAAQLALAHDGHLDVLALGVDQGQIGYTYLGGGAILNELWMDSAVVDAEAIAKEVKAVLAEQDPGLRFTIQTALVEIGALSAIVASAARFVDLVVQARPYASSQKYVAEEVVAAALFAARAPVLILPDAPDMTRLNPPRRIILAWNQSIEALVATRCALPLLKTADEVDVTVVDPPPRGPERSDPGGMLCQFLVRHGVKAKVSVLARSMPRVSDVLARHAVDQGTDLMVMGAFGHSRLREAVLGGATREVLESTKIPVLMAH